LEFSVNLIRVAFSRKCKTTRVAIGSRDELGAGTLLLTDNLGTFYSESYTFGKSCGFGEKTWRYFTNQQPRTLERPWSDAFKSKADLKCEEDGIEISLKWPTLVTNGLRTSHPDIKLAASLQKNSYVGEERISLSDAGLRIEIKGTSIRVISGSPESMIKLMGMLVRNEILCINSGYDTIKANVVLEPVAESEGKKLKTLFVAKENPIHWLRLNSSLSMDWLSTQSKVAASKIMIPHESWTEEVWSAF
jgi:hypothetical protein